MTRSQAKLLHDVHIHLAWPKENNCSEAEWPGSRTEGVIFRFEPEDKVTEDIELEDK